MKEIWINLELYIKSYEFSIFRDFFRIFSELLSIFLTIKKNKINAKRFYFRAGPTWMRRGTQCHVAAPRGPTRRLRGVIFIFIFYIVYSI